MLPEALEDGSNELPGDLRLPLDRNLKHWGQLDAEMAWCEQRIAQHARTDVRARKAAELMGIGPITASAIVASRMRLTQFGAEGGLNAASRQTEMTRRQL